ncbi:protein-L-isoaspartate O-methyltransferase [Chelatococcus sp. SYSU_G07232]|uniref:Protein-L-isoaspartate O-methyltransferase n=1 Tax=Chelatococcus albus TaxID=3047466 RepID=A0ABT7ACC4_9HYPH|nr:protein-L-isoaspartate O-methyltransferase [Chelatococcus sp. SYSU_G07232]MDJ1157022.1 protein-L-isoaspartate O-methyltransferase [Chelatococcus sp. SYSU_G07232]
MLDFAHARRMMVDCQVRTFDVTDHAVLAAFDEAPRERFVPAGREAVAYSDLPIPLVTDSGGAAHRVMFAPMILARLVQALQVAPGEKALDVGAGTGYASLILARLGAEVTALESDEALAARARSLLDELAPGAVDVVVGPLAAGHAAKAPYDVILVNGTFEIRPETLLQQLAEGGRLVGIRGEGRATKAVIYQRAGSVISERPLIDAVAPVIDDLRKPGGFVF